MWQIFLGNPLTFIYNTNFNILPFLVSRKLNSYIIFFSGILNCISNKICNDLINTDRIYNHIIPHVGAIPLNKLTQSDLQQFYAELKRNGRRS